MKTQTKLQQTNHKLPPHTVAWLKAESARSGVPQNEMVRRGIQLYREKVEHEQRRLRETADQ